METGNHAHDDHPCDEPLTHDGNRRSPRVEAARHPHDSCHDEHYPSTQDVFPLTRYDLGLGALPVQQAKSLVLGF